MISIYLFTKKNQFIFSISFVFNFQRSYLHLLYQKNLLYKKYFYLLLLEKNEFLQFYLQKYFILFLFKKSNLYKLF